MSDELACEGVSLTYTDGGRTTYALREVTVTLAPGRFYGIMGPSGSGKSSLLYVLSGLKPPTSGVARFGAHVYRVLPPATVNRLRRQRFGFVFQQHFLLAYLTALENILVAAPQADRAARARALEMLEALGMETLAHKYPAQLSGGERQRVAVVRAAINSPDVLFADEPTAALDHANGFRVIDALLRWRGTGTVVVVTHDAEMVQGADEIVSLRDGQVAHVGPPQRR